MHHLLPIQDVHGVRELRREPLTVSQLLGTRLQPRYGDTPQYLLFTTTQLLLRGKVLSVSAYTGYNDAADVAWLPDMTQRWTGELQRLNGRGQVGLAAHP